MALTVRSLGPFVRGVIDGQNPDLPPENVLRHARNVTLSGAGRMTTGPGTNVAMTFRDDQGSPANITSVLWVGPFKDRALVVGHSTVTDKVYLYHVDAEFTTWYDNTGAPTVASTALPVGVLWTGIADPPAITVTELLGTAYIAHNDALTGSALSYATRQFSGTSITDLTADLTGSGALPVYFLGCFAFQGHLWGWGYDAGSTASSAFRPELLRFGGPIGGALDDPGNGSFTVGHRVQSVREGIVGVCVAGDVAYVGTPYSLWPVIGYGRDSWDKSRPLDDSYGFAALHGAVAVNGTCYYWTQRGPARVTGLGKPEPLWDAIPETVASVVDPAKIVAAFDADRDQVLWFLRANGASDQRSICAYDVRRDVFVGPDTMGGIPVAHAGLVAPVRRAASPAETGPAGPPTTPSTNTVGATSAVAVWVNGDSSPGTTTVVEVRQQGTTTWTTSGTVGAGVTTRSIGGLSPAIAYEWRCYHVKNGISSGALGPAAGTQFTTVATLSPPTNLTLTDVGPKLAQQGWVQWTNSADDGTSTEVYLEGVLQTTAGVGVSSAYVSVGSTGSYNVTVRHVKSGFTPSSTVGPATATLTYGPEI